MSFFQLCDDMGREDSQRLREAKSAAKRKRLLEIGGAKKTRAAQQLDGIDLPEDDLGSEYMRVTLDRENEFMKLTDAGMAIMAGHPIGEKGKSSIHKHLESLGEAGFIGYAHQVIPMAVQEIGHSQHYSRTDYIKVYVNIMEYMDMTPAVKEQYTLAMAYMWAYMWKESVHGLPEQGQKSYDLVTEAGPDIIDDKLPKFIIAWGGGPGMARARARVTREIYDKYRAAVEGPAEEVEESINEIGGPKRRKDSPLGDRRRKEADAEAVRKDLTGGGHLSKEYAESADQKALTQDSAREIINLYQNEYEWKKHPDYSHIGDKIMEIGIDRFMDTMNEWGLGNTGRLIIQASFDTIIPIPESINEIGGPKRTEQPQIGRLPDAGPINMFEEQDLRDVADAWIAGRLGDMMKIIRAYGTTARFYKHFSDWCRGKAGKDPYPNDLYINVLTYWQHNR